jgi:hypothetical protein
MDINATRDLISLPFPVPVPAQIVERITRTRVAQAFNIFLQSVDASSRALAEMRLQADHPDVIIRPNVNGIGLLDKVDIHKVVLMGEVSTGMVLPELQRAVAWPNRLRRQLFGQKG